MKNRTFEISRTNGMDVTKKEATCFIHQLAKDASKPQGKQLYKWLLDTDAGVDAGTSAFCSNGLSEGSLIKLCTINKNGKTGVQFSFFKHGELWYLATEFGGDSTNDMHLACLHRMVEKVAHNPQKEVAQKPESLAELMKSIKPKPEQKEYAINVGDVFRSIDVDELVSVVLDQPSMLSIGFSQSTNCPERVRKEALIRATVSYLQNVQRKDTGILMTGFSLKRLDEDGKRIGHLVTEPLSRIANAYVAIQEDRYYSRLKPADANLQFAKDIIVNLLAGV